MVSSSLCQPVASQKLTVISEENYCLRLLDRIVLELVTFDHFTRIFGQLFMEEVCSVNKYA